MAVNSNLTIPVEGQPIDNAFFTDMCDTINRNYTKSNSAWEYADENDDKIGSLRDYTDKIWHPIWENTNTSQTLPLTVPNITNGTFSNYKAIAWKIYFNLTGSDGISGSSFLYVITGPEFSYLYSSSTTGYLYIPYQTYCPTAGEAYRWIKGAFTITTNSNTSSGNIVISKDTVTDGSVNTSRIIIKGIYGMPAYPNW